MESLKYNNSLLLSYGLHRQRLVTDVRLEISLFCRQRPLWYEHCTDGISDSWRKLAYVCIAMFAPCMHIQSLWCDFWYAWHAAWFLSILVRESVVFTPGTSQHLMHVVLLILCCRGSTRLVTDHWQVVLHRLAQCRVSFSELFLHTFCP